MRSNKGFFLIMAVVLLLTAATADAAVFYVSPEGDNANDGSSWATAYNSIQTAIDNAASEDQIWVKQGTYAEVIVINKDIAVYGGFNGTETAIGQQNWRQNPTIIDVSSVTVPNHAVLCQNDALLDGFTITGGQAYSGTGTQNQGGGIFIDGASPSSGTALLTGTRPSTAAAYLMPADLPTSRMSYSETIQPWGVPMGRRHGQRRRRPHPGKLYL